MAGFIEKAIAVVAALPDQFLDHGAGFQFVGGEVPPQLIPVPAFPFVCAQFPPLQHDILPF